MTACIAALAVLAGLVVRIVRRRQQARRDAERTEQMWREWEAEAAAQTRLSEEELKAEQLFASRE